MLSSGRLQSAARTSGPASPSRSSALSTRVCRLSRYPARSGYRVHRGRVLHTCGWGCGYVGCDGPGGCTRCRTEAAHCGVPGPRVPERGERAVSEELHDDAAAIWTACLDSLDRAGSHKAWLAQTRPVTVAGDTLVLAVPDEFVKEWVEQRYAPTVLDALARTAGRPLAIRVTVREPDDLPDEHP